MCTNKGTMKAVLAVSWFYLLTFSYALLGSGKIGINYGRVGNNLPSPYQSIQLLKSMKTAHVKIYDTDPETLKLFSGTKIHVTVMVANNMISTVASNQSDANQWVRDNVLAYYPNTRIRTILVGNEVFSSNDRRTWDDLVPAMRNIKRTLIEHDIHNIKVGTPVAMDVLESTFPPSSSKFRDDIPRNITTSLLRFLNRTKSYFYIDVYPYFPWSEDPTRINLDYALLKRNGYLRYQDSNTGLIYTNLLDQMMDSVFFAMEKLGFRDVMIAVAETGWPHEGDIDEVGANAYNAATYVCNLVEKLAANPPLGTPARPGVEIPAFVFSLYDENQKPGRGTERHWGLLNSDGSPNYESGLNRSCPAIVKAGFPNLKKPENNKPYKGKIWCAVADSARLTELPPALESSCRQGNGTCDELAPGKACYEPVSLVSHASYAFSAYWAKFRISGASCYFNGLAVQTIIDPSHGSCTFPSVVV